MTPALRRRATLALAVAALVAVVAAAPVEAGLGSGNPSMTVSATTVPADRATNITVRGTDFLVPPHDCPNADVFGGVYVFFGWVESGTAWGPSARNSTSNAGAFGHTYAYPGEGGDANVRDDGSGLIRLVSFTSGGESGAATPFHMDCNGNWETPMTVHGPTFQYVVPSTGEARTVDCRALTSGQCGIFAIGAHGKASATNEIFVPISFTGPAPTGPVDPQAPAGPTSADPRAVDPGLVETGQGDVHEEIVEVASPFTESAAGADTEAAAGFPGLAGGSDVLSSGSAAGVPGVTGGAPVMVAAAGSHTFAPEASAVTSTGRVPRWFVSSVVLMALAVGGGVIWLRRRSDSPSEVIA